MVASRMLTTKARVAELVYAHDLKSCLERDAGSIPAPGTCYLKDRWSGEIGRHAAFRAL